MMIIEVVVAFKAVFKVNITIIILFITLKAIAEMVVEEDLRVGYGSAWDGYDEDRGR